MTHTVLTAHVKIQGFQCQKLEWKNCRTTSAVIVYYCEGADCTASLIQGAIRPAKVR